VPAVETADLSEEDCETEERGVLADLARGSAIPTVHGGPDCLGIAEVLRPVRDS
jgi:hypothetical protein